MSGSQKKMIDGLLKTATSEAKASAKLTDFRYKLVTKFLESAQEQWGIGPEQFSGYIKDTLEMCKEKQDPKTAEKVLSLWHQLMFAPDSNVKNLIAGANSMQRLNARQENAEEEEGEEIVISPEDELADIEAQLAECDD
jgi:hypothetical protein